MGEMKSLTLNGKQYDSFVDAVARPLANATAILRSVSGESLILLDSSDYNMLGLHIYGKSTQDGEPTVAAPVDIVSVENPTVTINNISLSIPHALHGLRVASGGNYTDASGQQWICDEVDLVRGAYVQRTKRVVFNSSNYGSIREWGDEGGFVISEIGIADVENCVMCDKLPSHTVLGVFRGEQGVNVNNGYDQLVFAIRDITTLDELRGWLRSNSLAFLFALSTPIETPLSAEEIATYGELYTTRPSTTFTVDNGAGMSVDYLADTKAYIDLMTAVPPARLAEVTLLASAWKGSGNLYSQVVAVDDVTAYSKVDLLPSVEQLASFYSKDVSFVTENDNGVVTVFAIGEKPTTDYNIQASITEVAV